MEKAHWRYLWNTRSANGKAGQTYVFQLGGKYRESRVSYYAKLQGLAPTVGAINSAPADLQEAAGPVMKGNDPRSAQESYEFCGACHRTWEAVMAMGIKGINNARFPAYRLTNSPCLSLDDQRIAPPPATIRRGRW